MKPTILFLCPHSAAKSVMAAAYCQRLALEQGLEVHVAFAGTEPDDKISPAVADLLLAEGLDVREYAPRSVTREELASADWIISLGCDVNHLAPPEAQIEYWNDVPAPSLALLTAHDRIYAHVERLVDKLKSGSSSLS